MKKNPFKTIAAKIHALSAPASVLLCLGAAAALALFLEVCVFQFSWFALRLGDYPEVQIDLSSMDGWNGEALPVLPDTPTVAFGDLCVPVRSITVETSGQSTVLSGNVGISDEASAWKTIGAASFQVNPGGRQNTFTVQMHSHGNLFRFRLNFTDELTDPVFLTSVTLNARLPFSVCGLRLALMAALLAALFLILRFRLYAQEYQPDRRSHRLLSLGMLLGCLLVSGMIYYAENPTHEFLRSYPTLEEIRSSDMLVDAYMQQLDAFEKGQIELDLDVNPELDSLGNPYDKGEREEKGITYHWDRAYYNGKYYSYFGLAPLFMVYYPIFFLTGQLPTVSTAGTILAVFAIFMLFTAIQGLLRLFAPRANLLLVLLGEVAVVGGSFVWLTQSSLSFYYLPLLAAIGWLAAFVALTCAAVNCRTRGKRILFFALTGVSVVMLVLSRPNSLLLAIAFAAPLFLHILFDRRLSWRQRLLESACPFLIPVVIGGAAILYYNYIRFDSPFEFGTTWQLTESDIHWNSIYLSLHSFGEMLYHYFLEPFAYAETFPFISFTKDSCLEFGNYIYQECSVGLFQMPLSLGSFLGVPFLASKQARLEAQHNGQSRTTAPAKLILLCVLAGILILGYVNYMLAGIHIRYVCDLSLAVNLMALLLILSQVHFDGTRSARILYVIVLFALLLTIGRGLLLIFSNETNNIADRNPDFYLWIAQMF